MCEFKNCPGLQSCLLRRSSPCPGAVREASKTRSSRHAGLSDKGFLNRDALIAALRMDVSSDDKERSAEVIGIAEFFRSEGVRVAG